MPTADARVPTDRAGRYLVQLCRHLKQMSTMRHRPHGRQAPPVRQVDWTDTTGTIRFTEGTCTLKATDEALTLRIDADDEETLRRLREGITARLTTIGRRDGLTVHWEQSTVVEPARPPRRDWRTIALVVVAAVAVLLHVGIVVGVLANSAWTGWGADIVLAMIAVKIVIVALGRTVFHRRRAVRHYTSR